MREKYLIKDLKTGFVFLGLMDFKPCFGVIEEGGPRLFDSYGEAESRLREEYEILPNFFKDMIIEIVRVYEF